MDLRIEKGDYVPATGTYYSSLDGTDETAQRAMMRLLAPSGSLIYDESFGSALSGLHAVPHSKRRETALRMACDALAPEADVEVLDVELIYGEELSLTLDFYLRIAGSTRILEVSI